MEEKCIHYDATQNDKEGVKPDILAISNENATHIILLYDLVLDVKYETLKTVANQVGAFSK